MKEKKYLSEIQAKFIFPSTFARDFAFSTKIIEHDTVNQIISYPTNPQIDQSPNSNDKIVDRVKLLSKNKKIIFLGAQDLREWRKGMHNFINIISILKTNHKNFFKNILIIAAGKDSSKLLKNFEENSLCFENLSLQSLYNIYNLSDLIVVPSLQEWSSLMMSEAVSLEKTIFAFKTGSSKDLIVNKVNGYVFDPYNYNNIVQQIVLFLSNPSKFYIKNRSKYFEGLRNNYDNKVLKKEIFKIYIDEKKKSFDYWWKWFYWSEFH